MPSQLIAVWVMPCSLCRVQVLGTTKRRHTIELIQSLRLPPTGRKRDVHVAQVGADGFMLLNTLTRQDGRHQRQETRRDWAWRRALGDRVGWDGETTLAEPRDEHGSVGSA